MTAVHEYFHGFRSRTDLVEHLTSDRHAWLDPEADPGYREGLRQSQMKDGDGRFIWATPELFAIHRELHLLVPDLHLSYA